MADSSVLLEVIVEGKNIKVVQRDVDKLAASVNKAAGAEEKSSKSKKKSKKATDDLNNSTKNYNRGQKGVAGATANSTKAFSKQRDLIGGGSSGLVGAYATLAANIFAATALFGALKRASQVDQLTEGLATLGTASGLAMMNLSEGLREATGNAISLEQSMRSVATITSAGLDPSSIDRFGKAAANASKALGRGLEDTLDRITRGVTKLEPELLDEIGVFVRLDEVTREYAESIGKTANQLSNFEKRLAFQAAVLDQLDSKFGAIGDTVEANPYDKLSAAFADLTKEVLGIVSVLEPLLVLLSSNPTLLLGTITLLGGKVIGNAVQQFDFLDKGIARAEKSTAKLNKQLASQIIGLNSSQKTLPGLVSSINNGTITTKGFTRALYNQNLSISRNKSLLFEKKIIQAEYDARVLASVKITKSLNDIESNTLRIRSRRAAQAAVLSIQEGNLRVAIQRLGISYNFLGKSILRNRANISLWTTSVNIAKVAVIGFTTAIKVAGIALLRFLPVVGAVAAALGLLYEGIQFLIDLFTSDATKAYEKELANVNKVVEELGDSFKNLNEATKGNSSLITTTTQRYTGLSNSLRQALSAYQEFSLTIGTDKEKVEIADDLIGKSDDLTKALQRQYGVTSLLALNLRTDRNKIEIFKSLSAEVLRNSDNFVSLADNTKQLKDAFSSFDNSAKITTPFDDAAEAARKVTDNIDSIFETTDTTQDRINALNVLVEQLSEKELGLLGGDTFTNFSKATTELRRLQAIQKQIDDGQFEAAKDIGNMGTQYTLLNAQGKRMVVNSGDLKAGLREQRNILGGIAREDFKGLKIRTEALEAAKDATKNGTVRLKQAKAELAVLKSQNLNTIEGVTQRVNKENEVKYIQENINKALITELQTRKSILTDSATLEDIQARINLLTEENKKLEEERVDSLELVVEWRKGAIALLQEEQKYGKALLSLENKLASSRNKSAAAEESILMSKAKLARAAQGDVLSPQQEADFARTTAERVKTQEEKSLGLKLRGIALEYDLLDAQYALLEAELSLAIEKDQISSRSGEKLLKTLKEARSDGGLLSQAREAAENAAVSTSNNTVQKAEEKATLKRLAAEEAERQRVIDNLNMQADFYTAIGNDQLANEYRILALKLEEATLAKQEKALSDEGLTTEEKSFELAKKRLDLVLAERDARLQTAEKFREASPIASAAMTNSANIDLAVANADKVREDPNSTDEDKANADKAVRDASLAAFSGTTAAIAEEMRAIGPEGELMATVVESASLIANTMTAAFDVIGDKGASMGDKVQAGLAVASALMSSFSAISKAASDQKIKQYDDEINAEKKRDGKSKQSLAKIAALEAKKEKAARKAFEMEKKMKIAQTIIATAQGAMSAYASMAALGPFGPALGAAAAAMVVAMGVKQIGMIQATSFQGGSSAGSAPSTPTIEVGKQTTKTDLATSRGAAGELGYFRGESGIGGPENFQPPGAFMGAKYRAAGGPTTGYVVGEQGPELFVPQMPGRIIPEGESIQQAPVSATININAIDSTGVEDMLLDQRGNIIGMLREAVNSYGGSFYEEIDTSIYTPSAAGATRY